MVVWRSRRRSKSPHVRAATALKQPSPLLGAFVNGETRHYPTFGQTRKIARHNSGMKPPVSPATPVRAMVLAAGRGQRMRPLTDHTPKPLLNVLGKPLIEWHLERLAQAGVREVVINTGWLGDQFEPALGDGSRFGLALRYSHEGRDFADQLAQRNEVALETAGGIARALPQLVNDDRDAFWVVAGDVFCPKHSFFTNNWHLASEFKDLNATKNIAFKLGQFDPDHCLAHLCLVPNPAHRPSGDFWLAQGQAHNSAPPENGESLTYSTMGLFRAPLFDPLPSGNPDGLALPLVGLLRQASADGRLSGERFDGLWADIGTPQALQWANQLPQTIAP